MPDEEKMTGETWAKRWLAAAEAQRLAGERSRSAPTDTALEMARWDANGRMHDTEENAAAEVLLMLRMAVRWRPEVLRSLVLSILQDEVTERVETEVDRRLKPVRDAYAELRNRLEKIEAAKATPSIRVQVPTHAIPVGK